MKNRIKDPCRCGTGDYCRRHRRYGPIKRRKDQPVVGSFGVDVEAVDTLVERALTQRCGGGFRVLRKKVGD